MTPLARAPEHAGRDVVRVASGARRVFVTSGSDPMATVYAHFTVTHDPTLPIRCWSWLDGAKADARITRVAPDVIAIEPLGTTLLHGAFETLYRPDSEPLRVGDTIDQCGARIRVVAMREGRPSRIELTTDAPLDGSDVAFVAWRDGAMRRLPLPPVGESVVIPWSPGPSGFF
jgi:hypothetical protein